MSPGSAGTLPTGYQQQIDPSTGKAFYVNLMTGETSWTPPAGAAAAPVPMAPSAPPSSAGLPPGWEERVDPASGRKFYINHANKTTSWELPGAGGGAPPSQPSYAVAPRQASPDARLEAIDRDAAMARELAAQFDAEDAAEDDSGNEDDDAKGSKKDWASDASTTNCFLTGVKFGVVQRKHHCRYCGQIFVAEVCKKTLTLTLTLTVTLTLILTPAPHPHLANPNPNPNPNSNPNPNPSPNANGTPTPTPEPEP